MGTRPGRRCHADAQHTRVLLECVHQFAGASKPRLRIHNHEGAFLNEGGHRREIANVGLQGAARGRRDAAGVKRPQPMRVAPVAHERLQGQQAGCTRFVLDDDRLTVEQTHRLQRTRDGAGIQIHRSAWRYAQRPGDRPCGLPVCTGLCGQQIARCGHAGRTQARSASPADHCAAQLGRLLSAHVLFNHAHDANSTVLPRCGISTCQPSASLSRAAITCCAGGSP